MDHYIEARILPDPEFTESLLMGALFNKLHRSLAQLQANDIGVSFPGYQRKPRALGGVLRVHGTKAALEKLVEAGWLQGMQDHLSAIAIKPTPTSHQFVRVQRKQYKTGSERLRRRRMKRKGETYEQVCQAIPDKLDCKVELPFVTLRSSSTGQAFALFVEQLQVNAAGEGGFNTYGLSQEATVPWF